MEVKPGYKQTEVGVIPEEWEVKPFQSLAHIERGKFTARPRNDPKYYGGDIPFIQTGDVTNSAGWIRTYSQTLNQEGLKVSKLFPRGTLFFTIAANIGDVGFANFDTACPDSLVAITPTKRIDKRWLAHELRMRQSSFENLASHNAQLNINLEKLRPYLLPVPTPVEQEAIATALSDADALIESLEQLLTKKRQLKQGAMQELLTGKKRLSGFESKLGHQQTEVGVIPEDWDVPELGDILKSMQLGGNYKNSERETSWPLIKMGNLGRGSIRLDKLEFIDSAQPPFSRDRLAADDVLFNTRNTLDLVGKVAIWRNELPEAYFNSNIMRMGFDESRVFSRQFMNYILNTSWSLRSLAGIAIGTTSVAAIYSRDVVKVKIPLPTKAEQEAIAAILSDMDAEIAALEAKAAKARQLKQGMMQELLIGRIRLV